MSNISINTKFISQCLNLDGWSWEKIIDKLNCSGLESELVISPYRQDCIIFNPSFNRKDLNSKYSIILEISNILNCKLLTEFFFDEKIKNQNIVFEKAIIQKEIYFNQDIFTKYWKASLWFLDKTNENYNSKRKTSDLIHNLYIKKQMFGGLFFFLNYSKLPQKTEIDLKKILNYLKGNCKLFIYNESFDCENEFVVGIITQTNIDALEHQKIIFSCYAYDADIKLIEYKCIIPNKKSIIFDLNFFQEKIGQQPNSKIIENILNQLQFEFKYENNDKYLIFVSPLREDINSKEDIVSEILRLYNYKDNNKADNTDEVTKQITLRYKNLIKTENKKETIKKKIKLYLANTGWQEIVSYSLISNNDIQYFNLNSEKNTEQNYLKLTNAKNSEREYYRQELISSHLRIVEQNLSWENENLFFYEISHVISNSKKEEILSLTASGNILNLPHHKKEEEIDIFWLKGTIENILLLNGLEQEISFFPDKKTFLDECFNVFFQNQNIGFVGKIKKEVNYIYNKKEKKPIFVANIFLKHIFEWEKRYFVYSRRSDFPISKRDISFFFSEKTDYNQIIQIIKNSIEIDLQEVVIKDIFQNNALKEKKIFSITFCLTFQGQKETLTKDKINENINIIVKQIKEKLSGELRIK